MAGTGNLLICITCGQHFGTKRRIKKRIGISMAGTGKPSDFYNIWATFGAKKKVGTAMRLIAFQCLFSEEQELKQKLEPH